VKLLTGNDLKTGDVLWWTGAEWSRHVAEAADVDGHGEEIARREEAARRVNAPYVIDGELTDEGPQPGHMKDRMRAVGPSVRPDLALVRDPNAGNWTI
jgi:hypothetical protein